MTRHVVTILAVASYLAKIGSDDSAAKLRTAATYMDALEHDRELLAVNYDRKVNECRDEFRRANTLEKDIFGILHPALDFPDDVTVVEMAREIVKRLIQSQNYASRWRARAEAAEGVVALMDNKA